MRIDHRQILLFGNLVIHHGYHQLGQFDVIGIAESVPPAPPVEDTANEQVA
ncbi:hypothetical protein [Sphingomonas sp. UNC305MFCol5.2]|uniref:hypothetical protein n=1 Tax=Sphingomonas sp. UNC305MFCol5.2 TaxID=1449076 RepID=UPI001E2A3885|nr:hypothetical protein [Sphingomonas sp. UNC305MFCol5.2]